MDTVLCGGNTASAVFCPVSVGEFATKVDTKTPPVAGFRPLDPLWRDIYSLPIRRGLANSM